MSMTPHISFNKGYTNLNSFENNELDGDHAVRQNPGNSGL